jgi:hypothetical protein
MELKKHGRGRPWSEKEEIALRQAIDASKNVRTHEEFRNLLEDLREKTGRTTDSIKGKRLAMGLRWHCKYAEKARIVKLQKENRVEEDAEWLRNLDSRS